ncbi:hypothetical protein [Pyxidicoccus xibeiensis]|uniref:hypothetical protein n=1 Tax=Pyxidicoccus xibeiensis TaxID=2906759 RepID=UPI0020A6DFDB|nr:hypothetical protein [Pyxidicoccus xibeiensis]MCP3139097.1 hypothetical protein [Pyxidicoccus xibeiensis]
MRNKTTKSMGARVGRQGTWALLGVLTLNACGVPLEQEGAEAEVAGETFRSARAALEDTTPVLMPAQQVNRRVFTAAARHQAKPRHHIVAGAAHALARDNPGMTDVELAAALDTVSAALSTYAFDPVKDTSGPEVRLILRIVAKAEQALVPSSPGGRALRSWAQELLASMSQGLDTERALSSPHPQVDRYVHAEAFLSTTWDRLYDLAQVSPMLPSALELSELGAALDVKPTDSTQHILAMLPLEPLESFVLAHLQPDGSLVATAAQAQALVTSVATKGLNAAQQYANILYALDDAEQAYHDSISLQSVAGTSTALATAATPPPPAPNPKLEALKTAITKAKEDRAKLKKQLQSVGEDVDTALGLAAELMDLLGKEELAKDTVKYTKALSTTLKAVAGYTDSSIKLAERITKLTGVGETGFNIVSGAILTGQLLGAAVQLFSVLTAGPGSPPVEQVILQEVGKLKELIVQVQQQLNQRFDRVDRNINKLHEAMDSRFDVVDWNLGYLNQNVEELQEALFTVHSDLNRMDHDMYAYLADLNRDRFNDGVSLYLGWDARNPVPMVYDPHYVTAEALFYTWATVDSKQDLLAGPVTRDYSDVGLVSELATRPLSYNINYLSQLPLQKLGLPALSTARLASPMEWMAGAEAYARLSEEQTAHVASQLSTRHVEVGQPGMELHVALKRIGKSLFTRLHERYVSQWNTLRALIDAAEQTWETNPNKKLYGIDLWGGADQEPTRNYLKTTPVVLRCSGGSWPDTSLDLTLNLARWNHDVLRPLVIADNLDLKEALLETCAKGNWVPWSAEPTGFGGLIEYTYRLRATVYVRYRHVPVSTVETQQVYAHTFTSSTLIKKRVMRESEAGSFDPDTYFEADKSIQQNWGALTSVPGTTFVMADAFRALVRNDVAAALRTHQKDFYASIASRLVKAGDPLHVASEKLTGTRLLWDAYVALALPLSLENDEELRALLYGEDSVLMGRDTDGEDDQVDDLRDLYGLFGIMVTPPAANILPDVDAVVVDRVNRLRDVVHAILDRQATTGGPEVGVWTDATRMRVRLSDPP